MIHTDGELSRYYLAALKQYGVNIRPMGLPHITVVAGKYEEVNFDVPEIDVRFSIGDIITDGNYFWLEVECPWIHEFRASNGLNPNLKFNPHLTLGKADLKWDQKRVKRVKPR